MTKPQPRSLAHHCGGCRAGQLHARRQAAQPGTADGQPAGARARSPPRRAPGGTSRQARLCHRRRPRADRARQAHRRGDGAAARGHAAASRRLARTGARRLQHDRADLPSAARAAGPAHRPSQHRAGGDDGDDQRGGRAHPEQRDRPGRGQPADQRAPARRGAAEARAAGGDLLRARARASRPVSRRSSCCSTPCSWSSPAPRCGR